jgi:hypothetical protein
MVVVDSGAQKTRPSTVEGGSRVWREVVECGGVVECVKKKERTTTGLKVNRISVALKERSNCAKKRTKVSVHLKGNYAFETA